MSAWHLFKQNLHNVIYILIFLICYRKAGASFLGFKVKSKVRKSGRLHGNADKEGESSKSGASRKSERLKKGKGRYFDQGGIEDQDSEGTKGKKGKKPKQLKENEKKRPSVDVAEIDEVEKKRLKLDKEYLTSSGSYEQNPDLENNYISTTTTSNNSILVALYLNVRINFYGNVILKHLIGRCSILGYDFKPLESATILSPRFLSALYIRATEGQKIKHMMKSDLDALNIPYQWAKNLPISNVS